MHFGAEKNLRERIRENWSKDYPGEHPDYWDPLMQIQKVEDALESTGRAILGFGNECVVATEGDHKIIAIKYNGLLDAVGMKKEFYAHKILNTLFPKNFPRIYASFVQGDSNISAISGTIRQKINFDPNTRGIVGIAPMDFITNKEVEKKAYEGKFPVEKIQTSLEETGIHFSFDPISTNFISDAEGNIYYLDTVGGFYVDHAKKPQLVSYLEKHNFSDRNKRIVLNAFDRIIDLEIEDKDRYTDYPITSAHNSRPHFFNEDEELY